MWESTGRGWIDRGSRVGVPGWDHGAEALPGPKYARPKAEPKEEDAE